ncbi:MAG: PIG-L deacetylase family protein [Acidobacteriota bacterium]
MTMPTRNDPFRQPPVVLAVGAHPDDVEISCAGTLKALKDAGSLVHIATMTLGDCGSKNLPPDEIRRVRRVEAENACRILGAEYHYLGSYDFCIFNDDAHNRRTTALLREIAPQIVFTHSPTDYMLDHETTSVLVRNACFYSPVPNYDCSAFGAARALPAVPYLYYWDVMEGVDIFGKRVAPAFYVDISAEIEMKSEMLAAHRSQREWLRAQHGMDEYLETMRDWGSRRGREAARISGQAAEGDPIAYAEAFRQHLGHAYPRDNILSGLLPSRVILNPDY